VRQFELDFEGGLVDRYPNFLDCVRASVYGCGRAFKAVAADLDMSASALSQKLADNTDNHFALRRLPELLEATKDVTPIFWLVEKYCDSSEEKKRRAIAQLPGLMAQIERLVKEAQT
jgi:hypothetical protein